MTDPKNVVIGALVAALVYDSVVALRNAKLFKKKIERVNTLESNLKNACRRANYLGVQMDAAEIPLDDFDAIVLELTDLQ